MPSTNLFTPHRRHTGLASTLLAIGLLTPATISTAADFVGFVGEGVTVSTAGGDRYVVDVYAEFLQSNVNVVNVFDANISNANGTAFSHSDLNTFQSLDGTWAPTSSIVVGDADPSVDSFVTVGGDPGSSNTTTLDPNFSPVTASVPPANSGWYNASPLNGNGVADPTTRRVLVGRFVTATPGDTLNFSASITFADWIDGANGDAQQTTGSVSIPYNVVACDSLTATAASTSVGAGGTSSPITVTVQVADATCDWTASSDSAWLTLSPGSGTGDGTFGFQVSENTSTASRSATVTVASGTAADASIVVTQSGAVECGFSLTPTSRQFSFIGSLYGDSWTFDIAADSSCAWTASAASGSSWITITDGTGGTGAGRVTYTVEPNFFLPQRTGAIEVYSGGELVATHTVVQAEAAPECSGAVEFATSSISMGAAGGSQTVGVTTGGVTCAWYASTQASWITIQNGGSFSGDGEVTLMVAANENISARTGTVTIGSGADLRTLTIEQSGVCSNLAATPAERYVSWLGSIYGDTYQFAIADGGSGCTWNLVVDSGSPPWITVTSAATGTGSATVTYEAEINLYEVSRSGTISVVVSGVTVATHTVTQAGPAVECTAPVTFTPSSKAVAAAGESFDVAVSTNGTTCSWYATSNDAWITITNGEAYTGDGTMSVTVAEHTGSASRTGSITVGTAGALATFSISQSGTGGTTCDVLAASADSTTVDAAGTSSPVSVSVTVGGSTCDWSAISDQSWLTVSPGSGTGSGTFTYTATATDSVSDRTANLTVASGTATPVSITITQTGDPCLADSDSDGTNDCEDGCPNDPNKTSPGICGCGVSDAGATSWYPDTDNDGYGDQNASPTLACTQPNGYVANNGDCDDGNSSINPGAAEVCDNGIDDDCDAQTDEGCEVACDTLSASAGQTTIAAAGTSTAIDVSVTVAASSCTWTATSSESWLTITGGSGTGDATFSVSAGENLSTSSRSGTVTVSSGTATPVAIQFTQSGYGDCGTAETVDPSTASVTADAGSGTVAITTPSGTCAWTAEVVDGSEWLSITSGGDGIGAGTVAYSYTENTDPSERVGLIRMTGGGSFTITQAAAGGECGTVQATGGTVTTVDGYVYHTFTSDGTLTVTTGGSVEYLIVGGGGGGGAWYGGGGGAGGVATGTVSLSSGNYSVAVGSGGAAGAYYNTAGGDGSDSTLIGTGVSVTGGGGGGGASNNQDGRAGGGSGGGGAGASGASSGGSAGSDGASNAGGGATAQNGAARGGGGGGGAGAAGSTNTLTPLTGGDGGDGVQWLNGTYYGGGGGGGIQSNSGTGGSGGLGGGGDGATESGTAGSGSANTGGGGGAAGRSGTPGAGGSGIVIVRYAAGSCLLLDPPEATVGPTGSLTSQQVEVFDSSGAPVTFTIESGSSWVVVDEGSVTEDGFEFEVHNNPGIMPRDASIVVTASDGRVAVLPIHQGAPCEMIDSEDCDLDGVPDLCEILWGTASDVNLDGIPDECQSPTGDLNQDGRIDGADLTILLAEWGSESSAFADVNADGVVDGADLTILLANWGP